MPTFLITRWSEFYAYIKANSPEDAKQKADNKNVRWFQTMNLKPKDGVIEEILPNDSLGLEVEEIKNDSKEEASEESEFSEAEEALNAFLSAQNEYEGVKDKYMSARAYALSFVGKGIDPDHFA